MAEQERQIQLGAPEDVPETEDMHGDLRRKLQETSHRLMTKYMGGTGSQSPRDTDLSVSVDQLCVDHDVTPMGRLSKSLLPRLRDQLWKLMVSLEPANLAHNTSSKLNDILEDFQVLEPIIDLTFSTIPLCWAEDEIEVSELENLDFRRKRLHKLYTHLGSHLVTLFCDQAHFWQVLRFTKDTKPEAKDDMMLIEQNNDLALRDIHNLIKFFDSSFFQVINGDFRKFAGFINDTIGRHIRNPLRQSRDSKNLIIPVLILSRTFVNKTSKPTNNDFVLYRRMELKKLLPFHRAVAYIPYNLEGIGNRVLYRPHDHQAVVLAIAKVIATFSKCLEHLNNYLQSPPPSLDPSLSRGTSEWFKVWHQQFLLALHNITKFVGCDFPTDEFCASIDFES